MTTLNLFARNALTLILLFGVAHVQAATPDIRPGGTGDDTAALQAALSKCTNPHKRCDIRLGAGVFYTDLLLVKGFNGTVTGRGQGKTIIRPLSNRPLRSGPRPFVDEPTLAQPFPVLMHFANNPKVAVSELTFEVPASMRTLPYELPYPGYEGLVITESLAAPILVDGDREAEAVIRHVTFIGVDNDTFDGSTIGSAVRFEGQIRFVNGEDHTRKIQRGTFVAIENRVQRSGFGIQALNANHVRGLIAHNRMDSRIYAISLQDLGASTMTVVRNNIDAELDGILVSQTQAQRPRAPSIFLIAQNTVRVNETGLALDPAGGYGGVSVFDFEAITAESPQGETFASDITIFGNDITISENPVTDGIDISGDGTGTIRIIGNRIRGAPYDSGILVALSRGTFIAGNDLDGVDSPNGDVYLSPTTRDCRVIEPGDTVMNDGTNNRVTN